MQSYILGVCLACFCVFYTRTAREKAIIIAANVPAAGYTALLKPLKIANENNLPPLSY